MSESVEAPASAEGAPSALLLNELVLAHFRWFALSGRYGEFGGLPIGRQDSMHVCAALCLQDLEPSVQTRQPWCG